MFYNLDGERLEQQLRNFAIIRMLDSGSMPMRPSFYFDQSEEEALLQKFRNY